jgi:hypothetical protein
MTNKPDWKDAPDWANFLARDADGSWWWYRDIPHISFGNPWHETGGKMLRATDGDDSWRSSKEERP